MSEQRGRSSPLKSAEFVLVVVLVVALIIAMVMIFAFADKGDNAKDLLAIILGAFGAWIGAGAAYFFGRENLKAATESMLSMRGISPQERLARTTLLDMKPKRFTKIFNITDNLEALLNWFDEELARFFAVITDEEGRLVNVLDEGMLYRYLRSQMALSEKRAYEDIIQKDTVKQIITFAVEEITNLEKEKKYDAAKAIQSLINTAVLMEETQTAWIANETMEQDRKFITVVVDDKKKPIGYITTGDIRRMLLKLSE